MTDHAVPKSAPLGPLQRFVPFLKTAALVVTIVGAIPTAITVYHAWQYKIPFNQVSHRLEQYDILLRNIDCKIAYKALSTAQGTKVDVGACPTTGDISLKISAADGKATYEWIAYNQLQKPGEQPEGSFLDLIIGMARAGERGRAGAPCAGRARGRLPVARQQEGARPRRQGRRQVLPRDGVAGARLRRQARGGAVRHPVPGRGVMKDRRLATRLRGLCLCVWPGRACPASSTA